MNGRRAKEIGQANAGNKKRLSCFWYAMRGLDVRFRDASGLRFVFLDHTLQCNWDWSILFRRRTIVQTYFLIDHCSAIWDELRDYYIGSCHIIVMCNASFVLAQPAISCKFIILFYVSSGHDIDLYVTGPVLFTQLGLLQFWTATSHWSLF